MWCANCHSDVAAEVSKDNQRVHCASCQADLGSTEALRASTKTDEARELLERWANNEIIDPYGPVVQQPQSVQPMPEVSAGMFPPKTDIPLAEQPLPELELPPLEAPVMQKQPVSQPVPVSAMKQPKFRLDDAHAPGGRSGSYLASPPSERTVTDEHAGERYSLHQAHSSAIPAPHFDASQMLPAPEETKPVKQSGMAMFGQWMAYLGVLILTGGAAMVISGYFGGPEHFTSTGWLVSTFGQMLLFLGVVTLVSSGMEQTTDEVKKHIESLGKRIINFEQASQELATRREAASLSEAESASALRQRVQQELEDINRQLEDRRAS